jgi:hypothetical protein
MGKVKFTTAEIEKVLDGRYNSFRQDVVDGEHTVGAPQAISAATPVRYSVDGTVRNNTISPTYITDRWDVVNDKIAMVTELDHPVYVAQFAFTFDPDVAAGGTVTMRTYIDDTVPKLINTTSTDYKSTTSVEGMLVTWYFGEEAGYDAKNDGVYFTIEFSAAGSLYGKAITIYRT